MNDIHEKNNRHEYIGVSYSEERSGLWFAVS